MQIIPQNRLIQWCSKRLASICWLSVLVLALAQAAVWWGYDGHMPIHGDDIAETGGSGPYRMNLLMRGKIFALISQRGFLGLSYWHIYHTLFGGSFEKSLVLFATVDVVSSFLVWALLRRVVSPVPALIGALLFTGYISAFDTQTVFCMGFYPVVLSLHVFLLWLALSRRIPLWIKCVATGLLGTISMVWYEFYVLMLPLYPILWLVVEREKAGWRPALTKVSLAGVLPLALIVGYLFILKSSADPVWNRDAAQGGNAGLVYKLMVGAYNAVNATVGSKHWAQLMGNLRYHRFWFMHGQLAVSICVLVAFVGLCVLIRRRLKCANLTCAAGFEHEAHAGSWLSFLLGGYLLVVMGSLSGLLSLQVCPQRLTLYPSLGLSILVASVVHVVWQRINRRAGHQETINVVAALALTVFLMVWGLAEAVAMNTIVHREMYSRRFDDRIVEQIGHWYPNPTEGDHFLLYFSPRMVGPWFSGWSTFSNGNAFAILWHRYGMEVNSLRYSPMGTGSQKPDEIWAPLVEASRKGVGNLVPFTMGMDGCVHPVAKLELINPSGQPTESWEYPAFKSEKAAVTILVKISR